MNGLLEYVLSDALTVCQSKCPPSVKLLPDDLEWYAFPQMWGNTTGGFGGIGGQMMTQSQTIVVRCLYDFSLVVYFGGRFAYHVLRPSLKCLQCLADHKMPALYDRYGLEELLA